MIKALIALSGFIAVAMGAAGAHGISDPHGAEMVRQAALYQLIHTLVLLYISDQKSLLARLSSAAFALGIVLFSVSLYMRYGLDFTIPAGIVPVGGSALMLGWIILALSYLKRR